MDPALSAVGTWALTAVAVNFRLSVPSIYNTAVTMAVLCGLITLLVFVFNIIALVRGRRIPWTQKHVSV